MTSIQPPGAGDGLTISQIAEMLYNAGYSQTQVNDLLAQLYISTLAPSQAVSDHHPFYSSIPNLSLQGLNNYEQQLYNTFGEDAVKAFMLSVSNSKNEIISSMLDAWSENVRAINEQRQRDEERHELIKDAVRYHLENERIVQDQVEQRAADPMRYRGQVVDAGHFLEYLRDLPILLREATLAVVGSSENSAIKQNQDLAKAVLPMIFLEAVVIVPAAQAAVMGPVESLSSQIAVTPISDETVINLSYYKQVQAEMLPLINFFALDMVKTTTLFLYVKSLGDGADPIQDIEFARAYADQIIGKLQTPGYIEGELIKHIENFEQLPVDQKETAVQLTKLYLLASVLMLFTHIEGGKLSPQELKEMLLEGKAIPEGGKREEVVGLLRELIKQIPESVRADLVEAMLKYLDSMPQPEEMTSFAHALNAATAEVILPEGAV